MKRYLIMTCLVGISFAMSSPTVFAQHADDPFRGNATSPFQRVEPAEAAVIEIDNETMRRCFQMIRHGLQIAKLEAKRTVAKDEIRINPSKGDRANKEATEEKIKNLTQQIVKRQNLVDAQLSKTKFADSGRAEFQSRLREIQQRETEMIVEVERLKLQIRYLADENQKMRRQLAERKRDD